MKRRAIFWILMVLLCGIRAFCATLPRIAGQWPGIPAGQAGQLNILGNTLFANISGNNAVIDITDSTRPTRVGTIRIPDYPQVGTAGPYLLERNNVWLRLLDVTQRTSPVEVARVEGAYWMPTVVWPYLYTLKSGDSTMMILDFTNVREPVATHAQALGRFQPLAASGDRLVAKSLAAAHSTLCFFDISNRTNPVRGASFEIDGFPLMRGHFAFIIRNGGIVWSLDITDVANPKYLGEWTLGVSGNIRAAFLVGDYLWVNLFGYEIKIVDMRDPSEPKSAGSFSPPSLYGQYVKKGGDLFFADHKGITVFDVSNPAQPRVKGEILTRPFYGSVQAIANKVVLHNWYGPARLFDVTNAALPTVMRQLPASYTSELIGDRLFLRDTEDFLVVYDASDLRHPKELSRLKLNELGFEMASAGDRLLVSCSNTVKVVNFFNPKAIVVENSIPIPGLWTGRMARAGSRLMVLSASYSDSYLSAIDISDAARPRVLSTVTNSANFGDLAGNENAVYVSSTGKCFMFEIDEGGSLTERGSVDIGSAGIPVNSVAIKGSKLAVLLQGELRIYDISAPFAPKLLGALIDMPVDMARVIVLGDYAYIAGGSSGLITVQLGGEPPTRPVLDIINEGEMHRVRWTADFMHRFLMTKWSLDGPWFSQQPSSDTKMFMEVTAPNDGDMRFYGVLQ